MITEYFWGGQRAPGHFIESSALWSTAVGAQTPEEDGKEGQPPETLSFQEECENILFPRMFCTFHLGVISLQ